MVADRQRVLLPFIKLQGCGNSFIVIREEDLNGTALPQDGWREALARSVCERGYGLGADGCFIVACVEGVKGPYLRVDMRNPDGSLMGMCGNGVRCVVRAAYLGKWCELPDPVTVAIDGHEVTCTTHDEGKTVTVAMGGARFDPDIIPVQSDEPLRGNPRLLGGRQRSIWALSMGNPHCVIADEGEDLCAIGAAIETDPLFPNRTNVEMVSVIDRQTIAVRVWERGAGLTLACGTGACASAVAYLEQGLCDSPVTVRMPGGELRVEWERTRNQVYLTGPAEEIAHGMLFVPLPV